MKKHGFYHILCTYLVQKVRREGGGGGIMPKPNSSEEWRGGDKTGILGVMYFLDGP